jgi:PhnB protein
MSVQKLFPYLCVKNADAAIKFYVKAFEAREKFRLSEPSGRIGHAELDFDGMTLMLADEFPEYGVVGPDPSRATGVTMHLVVANADESIRRAVEAGATAEGEICDQFYGERCGSVRDPFGHRWHLGHYFEEVSPAEMQRRYTEMMQPQA